MKKLSVDTCVILQLIAQNEMLKEKGFEDYYNYVIENQITMELLEEEIKKSMISSYVPPKNCPIENMVEDYCQYVTKNLQAQRKIISHYKKGDFYVNNGNTLMKKPTEEEYQNALKFVEEVKASNYNKKFLNSLKEEYSKYHQAYYAGMLLLESLAGKVELCITSSTLKEVDNHTREKTNGKTKGALCREESADDFLKSHIVLVKTDEREVEQIRQEIMNGLLTKRREDTSPMKKEKNSVDEYGDLQIMAEANLAGLPLATFNLKDFIWDRSKGPWNERRRDNMIDIISLLQEKGFTKSLAYSLEEISLGHFAQPEKESSLVRVVHSETESERFKDEYEMI